ncbi:MAG: preQ(1) synthase [Phycisphaeraceae bacterium]
MPDASTLECFPNPSPERLYVIEHVAEEFTSVCPKTGHPDFGVVTMRFVPGDRCVELKSLKFYLHEYRTEGVFYEKVTNLIADDLWEAMEPRWLEVTTDWRGRGGIRSTVTVEHGERPNA